METQLLRDQDIFPTEDVLEKVLGKRYVVYKKLIDTVTGEDYGLALEWRFYNDGKAWLGKATHKKKTIFWLSVWEGFFRTNFYFTEKTRGGILELNIDEKLKTDFAETEISGKMIQLPLIISTKRQIKDVLEIVRYKKMLK